tara:strand:+ start:37 stop:348 length:312 start_codon:yes stop_codon:yes gene_type:complete
MENVKIQELISNIENLLNEFKSTNTSETSSEKSKYSIEEFVEVSPYKSATSIYRILEKLELGASWKKDIGVGKPRLFYSSETVNTVLNFIEYRDNNRGTLIAV